jgi:hypothetical protein
MVASGEAGADADGADGVDEDGAGEAEAGVEDDAAGAGWLVCGLFCWVFWQYPVKARPGANSKLLANISSAGISFLRTIL